MNSQFTRRNAFGLVLGLVGWLLLFIAFMLLALAMVLFAIMLGEFRFADHGWLSMVLTAIASGGVTFVLSLVLILLSRRLRRRKVILGLCPKCAYDLRAMPTDSNACPECGTSIPLSLAGARERAGVREPLV